MTLNQLYAELAREAIPYQTGQQALAALEINARVGFSETAIAAWSDVQALRDHLSERDVIQIAHETLAHAA